MKKLLCVLLSALMIISTLITTSAAEISEAVSETPDEVETQPTEGYCDGFYYTVLEDGTAEITKYDGDKSDLVIPDTLNNHTVTSLKNGIFSLSQNLKNVYIGSSIKRIEKYVFENGGIITDEISFDYKYENIFVSKENNHYYDIDGILFSYDTKEMIFYPSNNKTIDLNIPNGVISVIIGGALKEIKIPSSVEAIIAYDGSSYGGRKLEAINVSASNKKYCSIDGILYSKDMTELLLLPQMNPVENFVIPNSVNYVKTMPFSENMKNLTINKDICQDSLLNYSLSCVVYYQNMENIFVENGNQNYYSIDGIAYWYDDKLNETRFAFPPSNGTTSFRIPNETHIGRDTLNYCKYLENLTIPSTLVLVGYEFSTNNSIKNFYVDNDNPNYSSINGVLYSKDKKDLILYPNGRNDSLYIIPEGVENIAGINCESLVEVNIPKSIKNIDSQLGYYSNKLYNKGNKIENFIINGYTNTIAETYAKENGFTFISLGNVENTLGDVNGDGVISILDATEIQKYLASLSNLSDNQIILADFNKDGIISIIDATEIQKYIVGLV